MKEELKKFAKKLFKNIKKDVKKEAPNVAAEAIITTLFHHKNKTDVRHYFNARWFNDFHFQRELFRSKDHILTGYYFYSGNIIKDKVIIFSCGYGKGCHYYLDFIHYFTERGYLVFTYDNTATDESDGNGIKGFPQAILDLISAIQFVQKDKVIKEDKLILIGEEMGGYASGALAKDYKGIKKIVMLNAYNSGSDLLKLSGHEWAKENIKPYLKNIDVAQEKAFPIYSRYTVAKSMRNSKGEFLVIQSDNDLLVPMEAGINLFRKKLPNWKRVSYVVLSGRGHDDIYYSDEGFMYRKQAMKNYSKVSKLSTRNHVNEENLNALISVVDKDVYLDLLDKSLMECIITFIEK